MVDGIYRPRLKLEDLTQANRDFLEAWRIGSAAHVVPLPEERRLSLLWHGEFKGGETPVFVTLVSTPHVVPNKLVQWLCGVARQEEVVLGSDPLLGYLDAALSPVHTLPETLGMLACLAPVAQTLGASARG